MNNTRFATAIHILTLLAFEPEEWLSSDYIAGSININPVIVRKEMAVLIGAELVISRKGKDGGAKLNKAVSDIYLSEVYKTVKNSEVLGKRNLNTNPKCPVGKQINERLDELFSGADKAVLDFLKDRTLEDFTKGFN